MPTVSRRHTRRYLDFFRGLERGHLPRRCDNCGRYMKKKMTTAQFEQWSRYAVELRNQAEAGTVEQAEYERLLKI